MQARVEIYHDRPWLERLLALGAVLWVTALLLGGLDDLHPFVEGFTLFPLSMAIGAWLPRLARTRRSALGELRREGDDLVLPGALRGRRVPLRRVRGVCVAPGAAGASLVMELDGGTVVAAALDDLEDARRLAAEIRDAWQATDVVTVPPGRLVRAAAVLRWAVSLFALAYYLYVVREVIPGDKAVYGLGALFSGLALLVVHLWWHRRSALGTPEVARSLRGYPAALRELLRVHTTPTEPPAGPPRPRVAEPGERLGAWLARARRELAGAEAYRGPGQGMHVRMEQAVRSAEVPLRERALALRVLAAGAPDEVRRRIAEAPPLPADEEAWLQEVALAEDDAAALARVARRPPDFRA